MIKFVKSDLAKKLIIILIVLMIFNVAFPKQVKAWNFTGILMKPLTSLILGVMVSIDVHIGLFMLGVDLVAERSRWISRRNNKTSR